MHTMNTDIKFVVNEEKRTVVAIVNGCSTDAIYAILKADNSANILNTFEPKEEVFYDEYGCPEISLLANPRYMMEDTFVGVAKCHPEDEFSVDVGKRIAARKLHKTYNKAKKAVIKEYLKRANMLVDGLEMAINKIDKKIEQ